jgi:hypothetical protein
VEALRSESEEARQCAAWAFGRLGPAAIEALPQLARDPNPIVRAKTAVATSLIGGEAAREVAASLARDRHPVVRKEACRSLGRLDADLPDGHRATQVPRNGVFETRLRMDEPEPLAHVGPEILFSAPSDQLHRVRSFVSREHEGCARILATEPGLWYFEAAPQKDQSPRIQGVFECTPEKGFPGEVRVRETLPPGLQFDDGTPFFPVSAGLMGLNGRRRDGRPAHLDADWRAFMRDAGESGIRHARLFLLEAPWVRPEEVAQFPEFSPWVIDRKTLRYDLARFEPAFWDKLDVVLFAALQARIVVEIVVFDEGGLDAGKGNRWELHPFNSALGGPVTSERQGWPAFYDLSLEANRAAQERYVAYLLLRTRAFPNVWYQVNHEMGAGDLGDVGLRWLKHWPTFFEENGPPKRFLSLSVHPRGKDLLSAPRFDLVYPPAGSLERIPGLKRPQMAAAPAGAGDMDERWHAWRALFTGVPAVRGPWTPVSARDGLFFYARGLSALLTMVDAWAFEPLDSVILSLPAGVRGVAGRNGDALWVYLQGSYRGNGTLRLGVADPPLVQAQWFSTETGNAAAQTESPVEDGAVGLRPPDFAKDILLRVGMPRSKSVKFQWKQD